jgi:hypothetical protein
MHENKKSFLKKQLLGQEEIKKEIKIKLKYQTIK